MKQLKWNTNSKKYNGVPWNIVSMIRSKDEVPH